MIGLLSPDEYYDTPEQGSINSQLQRIGQLLWAPSSYLLDNNRRQAVRTSYTEEGGEQFRLEPVDLRTEFNQPGDISHPLNLRREEVKSQSGYRSWRRGGARPSWSAAPAT